MGYVLRAVRGAPVRRNMANLSTMTGFEMQYLKVYQNVIISLI